MLLIISDLHFQDTINDELHWEKGSIGIDRNVPAKAFESILEHAKDELEKISVAYHNSKKKFKEADSNYKPHLKVIIAGDCFDLHRSQLWFQGGNALTPRPYDLSGGNNYKTLETETEELLKNILDAIGRSNSQILGRSGLLWRFQNKPVGRDRSDGLKAKVTLELVPGNHEHELHRSSKLRKIARGLLGMPRPTGNPFQFSLNISDHETYVRHGHEYEELNFAQPVPPGGTYCPDPGNYLVPTIGDIMTTEFAVRLPAAFRARNRSVLHSSGDKGNLARRIYARLLAFDDVRGKKNSAHFVLSGIQEKYNDETWELLRPALHEVLVDLLEDRRILATLRNLSSVPDALLDVFKSENIRRFVSNLLRAQKPERIMKIIEILSGSGKFSEEVYANMMRDEAFVDHGARLLICGHTHHPGVHVLSAKGKSTPLTHIDTGTWRLRIEGGADGETFIPTKALTYVEVFSNAERHAMGKCHYNFWTGRRSVSDAYVLVKSKKPSREVVMRKVTFKEIKIGVIDEGEWGRAEFRLQLGVAGKRVYEVEYRKDKVKNNTKYKIDRTIEFECPKTGADVFVYGHEEDYGDNWADPDDPLPSGLLHIDCSENNETHEIKVAGANGWFTVTVEIR